MTPEMQQGMAAQVACSYVGPEPTVAAVMLVCKLAKLYLLSAVRRDAADCGTVQAPRGAQTCVCPISQVCSTSGWFWRRPVASTLPASIAPWEAPCNAKAADRVPPVQPKAKSMMMRWLACGV